MVPIHALNSPNSLDFHFKQRQIFFSESKSHKIYKAKVLGEHVSKEEFFSQPDTINKVGSIIVAHHGQKVKMIFLALVDSCITFIFCWRYFVRLTSKVTEWINMYHWPKYSH